MSNSLWPRGCRQASLSLIMPRVHPSSCPLSRWCHPAISSSAALFSFCLQPFPASGSFPVSWLFTLGGQNSGVSALASVLPTNVQSWFPLRLIGWSLCSLKDSQESSPAPQFESFNSLALSLLYGSTHISAWLLDVTYTKYIFNVLDKSLYNSMKHIRPYCGFAPFPFEEY